MFPLSLLAGNIPLYAAGAGLVALGALAGVQTWRLAHVQAALATEQRDRATEHAQAERAAREQTQAFRTTEQHWQEAQHENQSIADKARTQAAADAVAAGAASGRLRERVAAVAAACRAPAPDPAAVAGSAPAPSPGTLLADMFGGMDEAGRHVAEYADAARIAGEQCEADFNALTSTK